MPVPSLFASVSRKHGNQSPSYLKRSIGRQKPNVLASVDHAIEDGATDRAKQRAFADRNTSQAPVPSSFKKSSSSGNLKTAARERSRTKSPGNSYPRRSKSTDNKGYRIKGVRKVKSQSMGPNSVMNPTQTMDSDNNSIRSIRSLVKNSPRRTESPSIPAWKSRLQNQARNASSISEKPRSKSPKPETPKSGNRIVRKKESNPSPFSLQPPLAREEPKEQKKEKKEKKEKKDKKKKKKKAKDKEEAAYEGSEGALFNNDDLKRRNTQNPVKKIEEMDLGEKSIANLRRQLEETENKVKDIKRSTMQEISDMEKECNSTKEAIRFRIMKCIHAQGKKNDEKFAAYKEIVDAKQKDIDDLRAANQKLRSTIRKLPKQMSELIFGNQSLVEANEEISGHVEGLSLFDKKLQADQERLYQSSDKCKNEYLPRYRQQLWEGRQHLDSETKTKNLYRDCIIKITKKMEKSKQVSLMEEVASMVVETEGEVNPKFDPQFLDKGDYDVSSHAYDDSDSSVSSYSSSSSSDSD